MGGVLRLESSCFCNGENPPYCYKKQHFYCMKHCDLKKNTCKTHGTAVVRHVTQMQFKKKYIL